MNKFFDPANNRLVYIGHHSESDFWDEHWKLNKFVKMYVDHFVVKITSQYLPKKSAVLEGGCGLGAKVYSLQQAGYNAVGLDYAEQTVKLLNETHPDLAIKLGDVRKLPFSDSIFDGYWSLGVIEHFFTGYQDIASEMKRVLKKDGYLFITVPYMSWIRRLKAKLGLYPTFNPKEHSEKDFYQFALPTEDILSHFKKIGFELVKSKKLDGVKGFKDEVPNFGILPKIYEGKSFSIKVIRRILNIILSPFSPHICLFVFKKQ